MIFKVHIKNIQSCNLIMIFSKYDLSKKLLGDVTFAYIYIYIYIYGLGQVTPNVILSNVTPFNIF